MSFNGNRSIESIFRYRWCDRQWQDCAVITTRVNSGSRHCRPRHFAAATRSYIRHQRRKTTVATIVCRRSNAVYPFAQQHIASSSCYLWSAARVRTWAFVIYSLHDRHGHHRAVIWPETPHLRRRLPNLFIMFSGWVCLFKDKTHRLYRCCHQVDGIQSTDVKSVEVGVTVV